MKFIILGCGSSMGVPRPDGYFGNCDPKNKKNYRTRCSALIKTDFENILIDTSPDLRSQMLNQKIKSIHISDWPNKIDFPETGVDEEVWNNFIEVLDKVRQIKSESQKSMRAEIILTIDKQDQDDISEVLDDLIAVTNTKEIKSGKFKVEFVEKDE